MLLTSENINVPREDKILHVHHMTCFIENVTTCTKVIKMYKVHLATAQLGITLRPKNKSLLLHIQLYDDAISQKKLAHGTHIKNNINPKIRVNQRTFIGVIRIWNYFILLSHSSRKAQCLTVQLHTCTVPISSAGLFGLLLINASKAS